LRGVLGLRTARLGKMILCPPRCSSTGPPNFLSATPPGRERLTWEEVDPDWTDPDGKGVGAEEPPGTFTFGITVGLKRPFKL